MQFVTELYRATGHFPQSEIFGLVSQMRRAAVSVTSNIAEGYGRDSVSELIRFLYISLGSTNELDTQIQISYNLGFLDECEYSVLNTLNEEVGKMLRSLIYVKTQETK
jgi:four helix bundle protein